MLVEFATSLLHATPTARGQPYRRLWKRRPPAGGPAVVTTVDPIERVQDRNNNTKGPESVWNRRPRRRRRPAWVLFKFNLLINLEIVKKIIIIINLMRLRK